MAAPEHKYSNGEFHDFIILYIYPHCSLVTGESTRYITLHRVLSSYLMEYAHVSIYIWSEDYRICLNKVTHFESCTNPLYNILFLKPWYSLNWAAYEIMVMMDGIETKFARQMLVYAAYTKFLLCYVVWVKKHTDGRTDMLTAYIVCRERVNKLSIIFIDAI